MSPATGERAILSRDGLQALIETLARRGYRVVGPTLRDQAIVFDDIQGVGDLPAGWTDIQDGGAYCSYGVVTILYSGALLGALYDIPNIRYDGYRVLTNKPACGAMRGHGTVNVRFAFESQLDEIRQFAAE